MKLKIEDKKAEDEREVETDYLDLLDVKADPNNDGDDPLFQ